MAYLEDSFNHSRNIYSNDGICGVLNVVSIVLFYNIMFKIITKLDEIRQFEASLKGKHNISYIPDTVYNNVFNDDTIDNKMKKDLISLLDSKSLDRYYILYYIFKYQGPFYDGIDYVNTYAYYKTIVNDWEILHVADVDPLSIMNLDEHMENDQQIVIDNLICDCTTANIRFISWLYYSGIYTYLLDNQNIKKNILDIMNSQNLLSGNLFLKYQIYLLQEPSSSDSSSSDSSNEGTCSESSSSDSRSEGTGSELHAENDTELDNRVISEDLSDMNETTFAFRLLKSVKNIVVKSFTNSMNYTWKIMNEEAVELFHPVFD